LKYKNSVQLVGGVICVW